MRVTVTVSKMPMSQKLGGIKNSNFGRHAMKPKFEFLMPPYFCDIGILTQWLLLSQFLNKNLKSKPEVWHLFSAALDVLFMVIFLKIWKKIIFCSVFALYKNYWFYPIFCVKLPPRTKISIVPLFFVPHGFPASHFEA